jgi:hypothetical protein
MQRETVALCRIINPDFMPQRKNILTVTDILLLFFFVLGSALLLQYYRKSQAS